MELELTTKKEGKKMEVLLNNFKSMKSAGGQMKLLNIGPNFHEVLYITGLDAVFKVK